MYRRDYFLNETQRLAQMLAKLLGLKNTAGKEDEAQQVYNNALQDEYVTDNAALTSLNLEAFKQWLHQNNFSAPKLNTLAQLLYHRADLSKADAATLLQLNKVLLLLDILEQEHHLQLFENISQRQLIQQYIKQHYA